MGAVIPAGVLLIRLLNAQDRNRAATVRRGALLSSHRKSTRPKEPVHPSGRPIGPTGSARRKAVLRRILSGAGRQV